MDEGGNSKSSAKWVAVILLVGIIAGGVIYATKLFSSSQPETELHQKHRLRAEAEGKIRAECTNQISGLTRIINVFPDTTDSDPHKWKAEATADYVNHFGGVDRTNVSFTFSTDTDAAGTLQLRCYMDVPYSVGSGEPPKLSEPSEPIIASIDGAFGLKLGSPLPSDCQVLSSELNSVDGYILDKVIPPQTNGAFNAYSVALDPDTRLVSFIIGNSDARYSLDSQGVNSLLNAVRTRYGAETTSRTRGDYTQYSWKQDDRILQLSFMSGTPFISCWDHQLYKPKKAQADTKGL
jgi:hypothetical protein